jgi:hypothetical protein
MTELTDEGVTLFLIELTELSRKHGVRVGGCGCCGSPYLEPCKDDGRYTITEFDYPNGKEWSCLEWEDG